MSGQKRVGNNYSLIIFAGLFLVITVALVGIHPTSAMAVKWMTKAEGKALIEQAIVAHEEEVTFPSISTGTAMKYSTISKWTAKVNKALTTSTKRQTKHPKLYKWLYKYGFFYAWCSTCEVSAVDGKSVKSVLKVKLYYNASKKQVTKMLKRAKKIAKKARERYRTTYGRVKYVHDYLIRTISYCKTHDYGCQSYRALVRHKAVCAGYARAYCIILQYLGINVRIVSTGSHAWNIVKIGRHWYHVDVTWDDITSRSCYTYFLKSDSFMAKAPSHRGWVKVRKCPRNYAP